MAQEGSSIFAAVLLILLAFALAASEPVAGADRAANRRAVTKDRGIKPKGFKNLPDVTITEPLEVSWQEELNIYAYAGIANTSVDFGLPGKWNVGLSLVNLTLTDNGSQPFAPDGFLNIEKAIDVADQWHLVVGSQGGFRLFHDRQGRRLQLFSYVDNQFDLGGGGFHLGGYFANRAIAGTAETAGMLAGLVLPLPIDSLRFQGDYISGHNALSIVSAQLLWRFSPNLEFGGGVVLPLSTSGNDFSGLVEVNWR
jgi:hypothetical protein